MTVRKVYMVGIGGIGMSALAQLYQARGLCVVGSDRDASIVTDMLLGKGIEVHIGHDAVNVPADIDLLVYSDAVPEDSVERVFARSHGIPELSYFRALGDATEAGTSVVVSGTHGKTTTTAMLAKVLTDTGHNPTVICGSVMSEYGSNFRAGRSDLFVIEGCEYRRHFLHLHPRILVINNIELDHTDYYKNLADMQDAFHAAAATVPREGAVVADTDSSVVTAMLTGLAARIVPYQHVHVPELTVPGTFNQMNARAAKAAARALDPALDDADIDRALAGFRGTWRRFEYKGTTKEGVPVCDDYAHHPTAIRATLEMARTTFSGKHLVVVFHPHLYSRTRDLMDAFAQALALADEVLLAPIYPAREEPIPGVTSEVLGDKVRALGTPARAYASLDAILADLGTTPYPLLSTPPVATATPSSAGLLIITMGAGDVYRVAEALVYQSDAKAGCA